MPIYHPEPGDDANDEVRRRPHQSFVCGLLHCGPIALYSNHRHLYADVEIIAAEGFDVRRLNASQWNSAGSMHDDLMEVIGFPQYYGKNLDALGDCLRDIAISDDGGLIVVFDKFDDFFHLSPGLAKGVLDVFARGSRLLQIFGKTLIVLVQTNDPDSDYGPVGATEAWWNRKEVLREKRGGV